MVRAGEFKSGTVSAELVTGGLPSVPVELPSVPTDLPSVPTDRPSAPIDLPSIPAGPPSVSSELPSESAERSGIPAEILALRRSIDNIDAAMVYLLAERFRLTGQVGEIKATVGLPPTDLGREKWQMNRLVAIAGDAGLDVEFAQAFKNFITAEVIRHHKHTAMLARLANK